jgi:hypothetical protein
MRRSVLIYVLILSALLNIGVLGAAAYRGVVGAGASADLAHRLELDDDQRRRWRALEEPFVRDLDAGWREIAVHRERLVREVFSERPDDGRIETERSRVAELQAQQQQRVIVQFLREREILNDEQRSKLVDILLHQSPVAPLEQRLHGSAAR